MTTTRWLRLLVIAALLLAVTVTTDAPVDADPGDLALTFGGGDGRVSFDSGSTSVILRTDDLAVMADGRTVASGWFQLEGETVPGIMRFTASGAIDTTWNSGAPVRPAGHPSILPGITIDGAGRVLARSGSVLYRYASSGVLDTSFAGDGSFDIRDHVVVEDGERFEGVAVELTGSSISLLVNRWVPGLQGSALIARLTSGGLLDGTFAGDGLLPLPYERTPPEAIALRRDSAGNLLVAARWGMQGAAVSRITPTGAVDAAFGGGAFVPVPALVASGAIVLFVDAEDRPVLVVPVNDAIAVVRFTDAGVLDASYGTGGVSTISVPGLSEGYTARIGAQAGDVAYLASCLCDDTPTVPVVVALDLAAGTLLASFHPGGAEGAGIAPVSGSSPTVFSTAIATTVGGKPRLAITDNGSMADMVQLTTSGTVDTSYSGDGRSPLTVGLVHQTAHPFIMATGPDGSIYSAALLQASGTSVVVKTSASGVPDPDFGDDGVVVLDPEDPAVTLVTAAIHVLADGRVVVLSQRGSGTFTEPSQLVVLSTDGEPDPSFAGDGSMEVGVASLSDSAHALTAVGSGANEALVVAGGYTPQDPGDPSLSLQRITLTGTIDDAYGEADGADDGLLDVELPSDLRSQQRLIAGAADGSVIWASAADPSGPGSGLALGRVLASGATDTAFGDGGVQLVTGGSSQAPDLPFHLARRPNGGADLLGERPGMVAMAVRVTGSGDLDPSYSGDGVATLATGSADRIIGATLQGDRATFVQDGPSLTRVMRLTASGLPDLAIGPGGIRTAAASIDPGTDPMSRRWNLIVGAADGVVVASVRPAGGPGEVAGNDLELVKLSTQLSLPSAPAAPYAVAGDGAATVSWAPVAGTAVTYQVTASPGDATCSPTGTATACVVTGLTNGQAYTFTVRGTNTSGQGPASAVSNSVTPAVGAGAFMPLVSPKRFVDSRTSGGDTDDEQQERFGSLAAGSTRAIPIAGRLGLTAQASDVVLSVVAVSPTASGYFTVFPCGTPPPSTSSLNFTKSVNLANTVITTLGTSGANTGKVCVFTSVKTDLIIDASGSLAPSAVTPLPSPKRFVDSRNPTGDTDDEQEERFGSLNAGTTRAIPIAGRLGLDGATENVVLSVVAVSPTASGYLTVFPCGTPPPSTSSLNFTKSVNLANTVITTLGTSGANTGKVCVFTSVKTDLIIDASGSLSSPDFTALPTPQRFVDSRLTLGDTDDEQEERFGSLNAGTTRAIPIAGRLGLDPDTRNVVLSVVAVSPTATGYFTIYPCGTPRPSTSSLNFTKSVNLANTVITTLGTSGANTGKVCVYTSVKTDLIIDTSGSLT